MPEPLMKLVEAWRDWARVNHDDFLDQALAVEHRADELEAALKAWAAIYSSHQLVWENGNKRELVRDILGVRDE